MPLQTAVVDDLTGLWVFDSRAEIFSRRYDTPLDMHRMDQGVSVPACGSFVQAIWQGDEPAILSTGDGDLSCDDGFAH